MLVGTQLKLSDRRSNRRFKTLSSNTCHSDRNSQVFRPCSQTSLSGVTPKVSNVFPTPEKRIPEMRIISLHLEDYNTNKRKILRSPHKMPSFCKHFKRTQRNSHRGEQHLNDDFLVRGIEVGNCKDNTYADSDLEDEVQNELEAEAKSLKSGIQIQLTDCCQCVCDLFNSNFLAPHDDHDFNYVTLEGCNVSRPLRPKEILPSQDKELLDPNILKVIRITMSAKN